MTRIYFLHHPDSDKFYVGKTTQELRRRLTGHMSDKASNRRTCWIKSLKNRNEIPQIDVIEEVDDILVAEREIYWIAEYRKIHGLDKILNTSDGGDGGSAKGLKKSEETKRRMSLAAMGNTNGLGVKRDAGVGRKISAAKTGVPFSKEHIANLSKSKRLKSKLNESMVAEIRNKYIPRKYSSNKLSIEYGINARYIRKILNNKVWKL
jgi:hypothetical protein